MSRLSRAGAAALTAAIVLAGCGGGGGSSAAPSSPSHSAPTTITKVAPPPVAGRTSYGTARLTLSLPKALRGSTTSKVVRAIPHGKATTASTGRHAQFVDPSPAPGIGICQGNVIDIYVDGSLIPAIDGQGEQPDSLCVQNSIDGTQSVNVPLFSSSHNEVVVVEWDPVVSNILALGEADYGTFSPGSAVNLTVTMQENAQYIGVTDLNFNGPQLMTGGTWYDLVGSCPGTSQFTAFTADYNGVFIPVVGYGGTSNPVLTGSSDNGGTSRLTQSSAAGVYVVSWDSNCDGVAATATAPNPAYSIYNDVNYNYYTYYYDYYYYNEVGSPNQGIWNLVNVYTTSLGQNFYQLSTPNINGNIDIQNDG